MLLAVAERHARAVGRTHVLLVTGSVSAMAFYEKCGYKVIKESAPAGGIPSSYKIYEKAV